MSLVAYTYIHNAINGGYPLFESIASYLPYVDYVEILSCSCSDGTDEYLEEISKNPRINVHKGRWETELAAESALQSAWSRYQEFVASNDVVFHVEADEVFDNSLVRAISGLVAQGNWDIKYWRVQVEQNFQRIRWNAHQVHRVFLAGTATRSAHTTLEKDRAFAMPFDVGSCWDCTYVFRDQYQSRMEQNMKVWPPFSPRMVPEHASQSWDVTQEQAAMELTSDRWLWKTSPFKLPGLLKRLVGVTNYRPDDYLIEALANDDLEALELLNRSDGWFVTSKRGGW